ncbi:MAG TPA: divalent-cation tolerance protein CutA [Acidimicrobiia bacterium]|nr:divalent-cation tolerance protein CutA [Acidimicrobiia bacterium]
MSEHGLVLVTCGEVSEARRIARRLVEARLAAGVQILPIESIYIWQGDVVEDSEWLLIVKTRTDRFAAIETEVIEMHSYQVPPVVMIEMAAASQPYLEWIDQTLGRFEI